MKNGNGFLTVVFSVIGVLGLVACLWVVACIFVDTTGKPQQSVKPVAKTVVIDNPIVQDNETNDVSGDMIETDSQQGKEKGNQRSVTEKELNKFGLTLNNTVRVSAKK